MTRRCSPSLGSLKNTLWEVRYERENKETDKSLVLLTILILTIPIPVKDWCNLNHLPSRPVLIFWCCPVTQACQTLVSPYTSRTLGSPALQISQEFYSNPRPLSQWCFAAISLSVIPFFCIQSSQASVSSQRFCSWLQEADILALQVQHQFFWE